MYCVRRRYMISSKVDYIAARRKRRSFSGKMIFWLRKMYVTGNPFYYYYLCSFIIILRGLDFNFELKFLVNCLNKLRKWDYNNIAKFFIWFTLAFTKYGCFSWRFLFEFLFIHLFYFFSAFSCAVCHSKIAHVRRCAISDLHKKRRGQVAIQVLTP